MKTPIEKLNDLIYSYGKITGLGNEYLQIDTKSLEFIVEQAMKIEKQCIVDAFFGGYLNGESKNDVKSEEYYKEKFNK